MTMARMSRRAGALQMHRALLLLWFLLMGLQEQSHAAGKTPQGRKT